ncbi:MAG: hypothetical protein KAS59_03555 [Alphaproteobacteria bacterium]|nr:hypothetical protein [Alphaproteobacteria bacterium]
MSHVFSFGSVISDKNYTKREGSTEITSADILKTINKEINEENKELKAKGENFIPEIDPKSTKDVNDDRLYPVLERVAKKLNNKLDLNEGPGGSVHNAQQALIAIRGKAANKIKMYHKPASISDTTIFTVNGRKIYGSNRPIKDIELTDDEIKEIQEAKLLTFPKSSINNNPSVVGAIINERALGSKIVMNVHGSNNIENMDLYRKANAWIGTVDEMEAIDPAEVNEFLKNGGIVVETKGGDGLKIRYGTEFNKSYTTIKVDPEQLGGSKIGAGNTIEAALFKYMLGEIGKTGGSLEAMMDTVAYLGCAAASVVIGKKEAYLTIDDHSQILGNLKDIVDNDHRHKSKEPQAAPIKRNPKPLGRQM